MTMLRNKIGLVDKIEALPPFPAVATRIVTACENANLCAEGIASIISEDPALAARILRVANSPFYGAAGKITQISRAVVRLGTIAVRNLVIGMCTNDAFGASRESVSSHGVLWRHSVASAVAAETIAVRVGFKPAEEAFLAGLLHDIGQLAIAKIVPADFERILAAASGSADLLAVERSVINTDHTKLGVRILSRWGLPAALCDITGDHHDATDAVIGGDRRLLAITMLADIYAELMGFGLDIQSNRANSLAQTSQYLGLSPSDERTILGTLAQRTDEAFAMFEAGGRATPDCTATNKRAVWIATDAADNRIGLLLLEQLGYETQIVAPDALSAETANGAILFIALNEGDESLATAERIARDVRGPVVRLDDTDSGRRRHDGAARVFTIPRVFSLFDVAWIEERLNHEHRPDRR
ncbi:MAG: HDOD domain-containing protein [Phycisphaerales bacterium]|nr:HDOD domain-containing protein [Phycisphaerales bacterium]MCB9854082.1 HDOD domain-containing protein [Phycisphaerales bacterium]